MENQLSGLFRQKEIYTAGFSGKKPLIPNNHIELKERAKEIAPQKGFAYIAGGAGSQDTIQNNRDGFKEWQIVPRMFRDVSQRNMEIELFGRKLPVPVLAAPIGALDIVHPKADLAVAQACAALGIPHIFSNQASYPMETCANAMGVSPRWFQLYWSKSNELVQSFLSRAEACACDALVVTLDTTMLGWRPMDLDLGFLPFSYAKGIGQYVSDPVFQKLVKDTKVDSKADSLIKILNFSRLVRNYRGGGSFIANFRSKLPLAAVQTFTDIYSRPSISWDELEWLKAQTKLPIVLKGILHPDDAQKAIDSGADGIIVSNHGGRQVGGSISSIKALPLVMEKVGDQIPVLLDSGIRDGGDIFKALALGAKAVCIGRPYAYGLAINGMQGVKTVLRNLIGEFELTMGLSGCKNIDEITQDFLIKN